MYNVYNELSLVEFARSDDDERKKERKRNKLPYN